MHDALTWRSSLATNEAPHERAAPAREEGWPAAAYSYLPRDHNSSRCTVEGGSIPKYGRRNPVVTSLASLPQ